MTHIDMRPDSLKTLIKIGLDTEAASPLHKGYHEWRREYTYGTAADVAGKEFGSDDLFLIAFYS